MRRREVIGGLAATGTAALLGIEGRAAAAEPPPETTRNRVAHHQSICAAPAFVAKEYSGPLITRVEARDPIVILAGVHVGCFQLVGALETMKDVSYNRWREDDAEDTIRFYALRLQEAGMIKSSPPKIIAQGTDWRFLNELRKELKG